MNSLRDYELAFSISPVPMLLVSSEGDIVLCNDLLEKLFGYEPGQLEGEQVERLVPQSVRDQHPALRGAYFTLPVKRNMGRGRDLIGLTKSGEHIRLELGLDVVEIDGAQLALVVAIDIRERIAHEERLKLAMDAAATAMIMVDEGGSIVLANSAASALFGYEENELLGSSVDRLVPRETQAVHAVYRDSYMVAGTARSMGADLDLHARHADGHDIPVTVALTPVDTPDGRVVVSTIIDLSERLAAEAALVRKSEELALLNGELTQFAYSASHDLKAPLSTIVGLLGLCVVDLQDGNVEEVGDNLVKCIDIGRRSAQKIETVLAIARAGHDTIDVEVIDIEPVVRDIWTDLLGNGDPGLELRLAIEPDVEWKSELATVRLILENLLSNAARYRDESKPQGVIVVSSRTSGGSYRITVADNGTGIPREKQHMVFDMFKQIDERSVNGLGLSLVKKHVERLGGNIGFSSVPGEGSEFVVELPADRGGT